MIWLLDTNAWIDSLNKPAGPLVSRIFAHLPDVRICSIVKGELWHGAEKSRRTVHREQLLTALARFPSLPFDDAAARAFGKLRADLELPGQRIGPYDLQIAAIALVHGATLVTHNTREFARVSGLRVEDWQVVGSS